MKSQRIADALEWLADKAESLSRWLVWRSAKVRPCYPPMNMTKLEPICDEKCRAQAKEFWEAMYGQGATTNSQQD